MSVIQLAFVDVKVKYVGVTCLMWRKDLEDQMLPVTKSIISWDPITDSVTSKHMLSDLLKMYNIKLRSSWRRKRNTVISVTHELSC